MPFDYNTWGASWGGSWGDSWGVSTRPGAPAMGDEDRLWRRLVKFKSSANVRGIVATERFGALQARAIAVRVKTLPPLRVEQPVAPVEPTVVRSVTRATLAPERIVVFVAQLDKRTENYGAMHANLIVLGFEDEDEDDEFSPLFGDWDDDDDD